MEMAIISTTNKMTDYNWWHGLEGCSSQNFSCASVLKPVIIRIVTDDIVLISSYT